MEYLSRSLACSRCKDKVAVYTVLDGEGQLTTTVLCEDCARELYSDTESVFGKCEE